MEIFKYLKLEVSEGVLGYLYLMSLLLFSCDMIKRSRTSISTIKNELLSLVYQWKHISAKFSLKYLVFLETRL